jgi:hypothetical protein
VRNHLRDPPREGGGHLRDENLLDVGLDDQAIRSGTIIKDGRRLSTKRTTAEAPGDFLSSKGLEGGSILDFVST